MKKYKIILKTGFVREIEALYYTNDAFGFVNFCKSLPTGGTMVFMAFKRKNVLSIELISNS